MKTVVNIDVKRFCYLDVAKFDQLSQMQELFNVELSLL